MLRGLCSTKSIRGGGTQERHKQASRNWNERQDVEVERRHEDDGSYRARNKGAQDERNEGESVSDVDCERRQMIMMTIMVVVVMMTRDEVFDGEENGCGFVYERICKRLFGI